MTAWPVYASSIAPCHLIARAWWGWCSASALSPCGRAAPTRAEGGHSRAVVSAGAVLWWWQDLQAGPSDQDATPAAHGRVQARDQGVAPWAQVQHVHAELRCAMCVRGLSPPLGPPVRVAQRKGD